MKKTYIVGGAVRDVLLGLPIQDRDYVVVGSTPEQMLAEGFRPVGKDFPVFLHPKTHQEYALARTERKTAAGYKGFVFHTDEHVSLEQDLIRRDLTINAMAQDEQGVIHDPFNGQQDLQQRIFRHVSDAFAEDPVRILRIARFAARFTKFTVAPETRILMQAMVLAGEVDALVPERVWQELARGLMEEQPSRMFQVLHDCGALARILPEFDAVWQATGLGNGGNAGHTANLAGAAAMVDLAAQAGHTLAMRFAALGLLDQGNAGTILAEVLCTRLRVPNECRDLALMSAREQTAVDMAMDYPAETILALLMRCDAFRKPQRFIEMLDTLQNMHAARLLNRDDAGANGWSPVALLSGAMRAAQTVRAGEVEAMYSAMPERIPEAIYAARVGAISEFRDAFTDKA